MKTWKLFWGLGLILLAAALVLDAVGVLAPISSAVGDVSILALLAALLLLCYAIARLCRGRVGEIFLPLALIFMLFEKNIAYFFKIGDGDGNIINNWLLFGCALMLWIGFSILLSGIRKKKKHNCFEFEHKNKHGGSLGSSVRYIACDGFKYELVENNLGACTIFFGNTDKYDGDGVLEIENNLGSVVVNVPDEWDTVVKMDNSLGNITSPKPTPGGKILNIKGENNLGSIVIKKV